MKRAFPPGLLISVLSSLALSPAALGQEEKQAPGLLDLAIRSPHEKAGDFDALAGEWLAAVKARGLPPGAVRERAGEAAEPVKSSGVPDELVLELILRRLTEIRPQLADPLRLIPHVEEAYRLRYPDGLQRQLLRGLLEELYRRAGREEDRRELQKGQGFLGRLAIIGPFGLGGPSQLRRPFPPEREVLADASYPGRKGPISWRVLERPDPLRPLVHPAAWIYPHTGVVYLLAQARSEAPAEAVLHVSGREPVVIWVNDRLLAREDPEPSRPNRRAYPVRLSAGVNRILLKTLARPESWLSARLAGPDGEPLPGLSLDEPPGEAGTEGLVRPRVLPLPDPVADPVWKGPFRAGAAEAWEASLVALAESKASPAVEAGARIGLALLLSSIGSPERAVLHAERALELLPLDAAVAAHAARVLQGARYLPRAHARSRARAAFESAVRSDPDYLPAHLPLARLALEDNEAARAAERLNTVLEKSPGFTAARIQLLELYEGRGWEAEAEAEARELAAKAPRSPEPALYRLRRYRSRKNPRRALEEARAAIELDRGRSDLYSQAADLAEETGDARGAEAALIARRALDPEDASAARALGGLHERRRNWDGAIAVQMELDKRNPLDPAPAAALGRILERAGRAEEARSWFEKVLRREPGDIAIARYLARRDGSSPRDEFWSAYDESLEEWLPRVPPAGETPGSSAVAILDIAVLKLYPDGSSSEYTHQALRLLSEEAKDELASASTPGEIIALRTVTADGRSLEPVAATGKQDYVLPAVAPGSTVEYAYRVDRPRFDGWMLQGHTFFFQDFEYKKPFLLSRYAVLIPPGLSVDLIERALAGGEARAEARAESKRATVRREERDLPGGGRVVVYEAREAPRLEPEVGMPHREDYIPNVELGQKRSWDDVASRLEDSVLGIARPAPELARAAAAALASLEGKTREDPLQKARALYAHVNELVSERGGPGQAVEVLINRAGDRTVLLKGLLDSAGVPSRWAFLRPRDSLLPKDDGSHPRPELFSERHLLIEPPGAPPVFLSLSVRRAPFGKLSLPLQGGTALVLDPEGGCRLVPVPPSSLEDSSSSTSIDLLLSGKGIPDLGARARVDYVSRSLEDYGGKESMRTVKDDRKRQSMSRFAAGLFPGAKLLSGDLPGLSDPDAPFALRVELEAPRVLSPRGDDEVLLRQVLPPVQMIKRFIRRPRRDHPYRLGREVLLRDRSTISCGPAFRFARLPGKVSHVSLIGCYTLAFTPAAPDAEGNETVVVERQLTLKPETLPPEEFPRIVEFAEAVDRAEEERIVLERRQGPGG